MSRPRPASSLARYVSNGTRLRRLLLLAVATLVAGAIVSSPYASAGLENVQQVRLADAAGLGAALRQAAEREPDGAWVTYTVPAVSGLGSICCHEGSWRRDRPSSASCRLGDDRNWFQDSDRPGPPYDVRVVWRVDRRGAVNVRAYTTDCKIDGEGGAVFVIDDVTPADSVRELERLLDDRDHGRVAERALGVLAAHDGSAADAALRRATDPERPSDLRAQAAFWIGNSRGEAGFPTLVDMLHRDPSSRVVEQVVFALSLSTAEGALSQLIAVAHDDPRPGVRGKALFWLAQRAGERVVETLDRATRDDPDADVREQAVFAVSQLPNERAVPLLIELARANPHPEVRERALFWLGQSDDPRALKLFEEILLR